MVHGPVLVGLVEIPHGVNVGSWRDTLASLPFPLTSPIHPTATVFSSQLVTSTSTSPSRLAAGRSHWLISTSSSIFRELRQSVVLLVVLLLFDEHIFRPSGSGVITSVLCQCERPRLMWRSLPGSLTSIPLNLIVHSLDLLDRAPAGGGSPRARTSLHLSPAVLSPDWHYHLSAWAPSRSRRPLWRRRWRPRARHPGPTWLRVTIGRHLSIRTGAVARISSVSLA